MEALRKIENQFARAFKFLPGLSESVQKLLSDYLWLVALVGSAFSLFFLAMLIGLVDVESSIVGLNSVRAIDLNLRPVTIIAVFELVLITSLMLSAIGLLKKHKRSGWDIMFLVALVSFVSCFLQFCFSWSYYNLFTGLVWLLIEIYFLLQVKSHFVRG